MGNVGISSALGTLAPDDGYEEIDFASVISVIHWMGATELSGTSLFEDIQMVRGPLGNERPYPDKIIRDLRCYSITN
jgi:hypothetical protein